jgi:hypothetical protein
MGPGAKMCELAQCLYSRKSAICGFVSTLTLALMVIGWFSTADGVAGDSSCVKTQRLILERGHNSRGEKWMVAAGVRANNGCATWLLSLEVAPSGTRAGTWRWGRAIQPNGSLPADFGIAAGDEVARVGRVFSGMTSGTTRSVVVHTWEGKTIVIHPKRPVMAMRRRHEWLKNLKYFVRFYPRGDHVRVAEGFDAGHTRLFRVAGSEGAFETP